MKKQKLIPTDFLFKNRRIKILLKSAIRIRKSAKIPRFRNPWKIRVFLTDFCKNPNPIKKFD